MDRRDSRHVAAIDYRKDFSRRRPARGVNYHGRPGLSPVNAGLVAAKVIPPRARILEVGTGAGTEAIALGKLGFHVLGTDTGPVGLAERRAAEAGVSERVQFLRVNALDLQKIFPHASFSVVLDVLTYNNIRFPDSDRRQKEADAYVEQLAHVLKPKGRWIVQWRTGTTHREENDSAYKTDLPENLWRWFRTPKPIWTHIPEYCTRGKRQGFAPIGLAILTRR